MESKLSGAAEREALRRRRIGILVWASALACAAGCCSRLASAPRPPAGTISVHDVHDGETFEYIVVGGGAAGGAVAARLAQAGRRVLLLEAGGVPGLFSRIPASGGWLIGSSLDYFYEMEPNNASCLTARERSCRFSCGRALGGSTAMNFMMYTRGHPADYAFGAPGWAWPDLAPYFLRSEGLRDRHRLPESSAGYHNVSGPVPIGFFGDSENPWSSRILQGFEALGVPFNPDFNAESQIGVAKVLAFTDGGERVNTAEAYLRLPGVAANLRLAVHTTCLRVIFDKRNAARGVVAMRGGVTLRLFARKEVVLAAGAIGSARLLMASGVGPADHLRQHNISVRADLPVGEGLADHVAPIVYMQVGDPVESYARIVASKARQALRWLISRSGPLATTGISDVTAFVNTACYDFAAKRLRLEHAACDLPTTQYIHAAMERGTFALARPAFERVVRHAPTVFAQLEPLAARSHFIVVMPTVLRPRSRGRVRLAGPEATRAPLIAPNYLHDDADVKEAVRALRILEDLTRTPVYRRHGARLIKLRLPGCPRPSSAGYWACYVRHMTMSVHHAVGTTALGRVLDARLRVLGVRGLRVADAGALPSLPGANTAAAVLALAERAADLLLQDETRQSQSRRTQF